MEHAYFSSVITKTTRTRTRMQVSHRRKIPLKSLGYRLQRRQSSQPWPRRNQRGLRKQASAYSSKGRSLDRRGQASLEKEERSQDRRGQFTRPLRPNHHPGYSISNALETSALKCAGALSCWNHIPAFKFAGTHCSRTGSTSYRNTRYVPPSRYLGRRYDPIK
ncbi:hypothetical protein TNCV_473931 [Trichonephila clavipes]|nr:hypothetical protein TNCV_473931 [Trichonephila clavipes]